jgi:hypothetical protein
MKGKFMLAAMAVSGIVFYLSGCAKESADRLSEGSTCDTTGVSLFHTDTTYPARQLLYLSPGYCCLQRHRFEQFPTLQAHVANGDLVSAVTHTGTVTPMPYELPMLPSCEVNTIVAWVHQGALNN